ncbi:MAG: hypothetical protein NC308_00245 [Clostridium sp.]|nr:hypothetical protein [Bacteroides sp.]MCM1197296.1 hypothetical protein [Clostridium sp.]
MKKIFLAAAACLALFSCDKPGTEPTVKKDTIAVTPQNRIIKAEGGTAQVIVSSSSEWTLEGKADYNWVTPSVKEGVDGDFVTFTVEPNTGDDKLVSEWVFTCGTAKDEFILYSLPTTKTPDFLTLVSDSELVLGHEAGRIEILLSSSLHYRDLSCTISEGAAEWLDFQATLEGDEDGSAKVVIDYAALTGLDDRSATITVSGAEVEPVVVNVLQEAKHRLEVTQQFYTASTDGETIIVPVIANVEYKVEISSDGNGWLTKGNTTAEGIEFKVAALESGKRSAVVTFTQTDAKDGEETLSAKITITQIDALIGYAAKMTGNRLYPKWDGTAKPGSLNRFTLETLVKFDNFNKASGSIFTLMGIEGQFLLRMGDVGNPLTRLQIATSYGNYNVPFDFEANRWYHVAVTFDYGTVVVYFDGVKAGEYTFSKWGSNLGYINLSPAWSYEPTGTRCFWVGYSYETNRDLYGLMTEIRIWNKTLTEEEINAENHFYTVDPASEGLFSYWKFTEGQGNTIADATGKGNTLYGELNVTKHGGDNYGDAGIEWEPVALPDK